MARSYTEERAVTAAINAIEAACSEAYRSGFLAGKRLRDDPRAGSPAPTYISGSTPGKVYSIADMPTRYLRNVVNMTDFRVALGIRREIEAELERRTGRDGALADER